MTSKETLKVLQIISTAFPNYRPQYDKEQMANAVELWTAMFNEEPCQLVGIAVKQYISNGNQFAPSIGQIKEIIKVITNQNELSEAEAWNMVLKAISRSAYFAEEEFEKLPKDIQRAIGSAEYLRQLALSDNLNASVESSNFYRNYRAVKERAKHTENVPPNIMQYIESMQDVKQIENKQQQASDEARDYYTEAVKKAVDNYHQNNKEETIEVEPIILTKTEELKKRLNIPDEADELAEIEENKRKIKEWFDGKS